MGCRPARPVALTLLLGAVASCLGPRPAAADDAPTVETRLYSVHALSRPYVPFFPEEGPYPLPSRPGDDEEQPLFGLDPYSPWWPLGPASSILEHLRTSVGTPQAWGASGVVAVPLDVDGILLRAPASLHDAVAAGLADEVRRAVTTLVVDVVALAGDPAAARGPGGLAAGLASGALRPLGFARSSVGPWGPALLRVGAQHAVLGAVATEVAQSRAVTDPLVWIRQDGLACEIEGASVAEGRVRLRVRGWWSAPPTLAAYPTKEGDVLELPFQQGCTFDADLDAAEGAWSLVLVGGGVSLGVRARVDRPAVSAEAAGEVLVGPEPVAAPVAPGPILRRTYDVSDLEEHPEHSQGPRLYVVGSGWNPREPPDLPESLALVPFEYGLVAALPLVLDPASWQREGARLQYARKSLVVGNDAPRQEKMRRLLATLRQNHLRSTRVSLSILSVPAAALPELWTGLDDEGAGVSVPSLLGRPGARLLHSGDLLLRDGQRLGRFDGTRRGYLADFDVEIACKASIARPVRREVWEGSSLDVTVSPVLGAPAVVIDGRIERGTLRAMRAATSVHGSIDCPVYDRLRCVGSRVVPRGSTRILGAGMSGPDVLFVLVSVSGA